MKKFAILYVDDEESNLRIFKDTFRRNYNVFTATSAKEGINILEKEQINLILSDQRMPEMTGVEFLKYTLEKFPKINRILVTGFTDFDAAENAINQAHIFQYIQKPWKEESLNATIEDALKIYRLEQENAQQKEELLIAKLKAEESDNLKTEFLNNLSHEIRTPLNGIYGFTSMLKPANISQGKKNHYISIIHSCTQQLVNTIDHILAYSKLVTKQVTPTFKQLSLNNLLSEIFSVFENEAKKKGIDFFLSKGLPDDKSIILTDKIQLNSILSNLLNNAFKYTEDGFVKLEYILDNDKIVISVTDTGVGIHSENKNDIFKQFSRENKSYTSETRGLGLGLSIAKENAKLLKADIWLESEKGKGTTFFVSIPYRMKEKPSEEKPSTIPPEPLERLNHKILIAEDDYINYMYIETLVLRILGKETDIYHAVNGKEAKEMCMTTPDIELVLMDINMPILNGYNATIEIKQFKPDMPIIVQTAYSTDEDQKKAVNAGCDDFITKPINPTELESKILKLINKQPLTHENN